MKSNINKLFEWLEKLAEKSLFITKRINVIGLLNGLTEAYAYEYLVYYNRAGEVILSFLQRMIAKASIL